MGGVCLSDLPKVVSSKLSPERKSTELEASVYPLTIKFSSATECSASTFTLSIFITVSEFQFSDFISDSLLSYYSYIIILLSHYTFSYYFVPH